MRDSLPIDMLLSAVSVLVVAQSSSEVPEGLMNNPVYILYIFYDSIQHNGDFSSEGYKCRHMKVTSCHSSTPAAL